MRGAFTVLVVIVIAGSLSLPMLFGFTQCHVVDSAVGPEDDIGLHASTGALVFPVPPDTSDVVSEYSPVSRALLIPGGSTDSILSDLNDDGRTDLIVAVSESNQLSVFIRSVDGTFPSTPSSNTILDRTPISLGVADLLSEGAPQVIVLMARLNDLDTEVLSVFNFTSEYLPLHEFFNRSVYQTAQSFIVAQLNGDIYPDVALVCPELNPESSYGTIEVRWGPSFSSSRTFSAGHGSSSITFGNFSGDTLTDLAVGNYRDRSISVFYQPFFNGMTPDKTLIVDGSPVGLASGLFNGDALDDIAAATVNESALRFFFQSGSGGLPVQEYGNRSLLMTPSHLDAGDLNGDGLADLIPLSYQESICQGFYQLSSSPIWPYTPDISIPTGSNPRDALVGDLDGDPMPDMALSTARADWSGGSIAIYPARSPHLSNSNATVWADRNAISSAVETGDIDGDDVDDMVWLHPLTNAFGYKLGDVVNGFPESESLHLIGHVPKQMALVNLGNDSRSEIVLSVDSGNEVLAYSWNPSSPGSFNVTSLTCSGDVDSFATGLFNRDSYIDLVAATKNGTVEVFYGIPGDGLLSSAASIIIGSPHVANWTVVSGDFNSDGLADIAYPYPGCKISVHYQKVSDSSFALTPDVILFSSGSDFNLLWSGDLTGDDRADIAATRPGDPALYLFNQVDFETTFGPYGTLLFPEVPKFVSVVDATDDWRSDVLAIFDSADLLFLYKQENGTLPAVPSMVFVAGGEPNYATIGDATQDHRGDLLVNEAGSHSVSAWRQVNYPPVAHVGGPFVARQGDPVELAGWATTGRSESPYMEFNWSFGDGAHSGWVRDATPVHVYHSPGNLTVELTVRDPWGATDQTGTTIQVLDSIPHPDFSWTPLSPREGDSVALQDGSFSYDPIVRLDWWIDGDLVRSGTPANASSFSWQFQNGSHAVTLQLEDSDGSSNSTTKSIEVLPINPVANLSSPSSAMEGDDVDFVASIDDWNGGPWDSISLVEWDFSYDMITFVAEENTGTTPSTSHQFAASGYSANYTVAVRVTDVDGNRSLAWVAIEIYDIGPTSSFTIVPAIPTEGVQFRFQTDVYTWDGVESGYWRLDGPGGMSSTYPLSGTTLNIILGDGQYTMTLTVNESDGDTDSWSDDFIVDEVAPQAVLGTSPSGTEFVEFSDITFTATVSSYDAIVSYEWDFDTVGAFEGDLITTSNTVTYSYIDVNDYIPEVRVTDADGSSMIAFLGIRILQDPLTGSFDDDVVVTRDTSRTYIISFNASSLADRYRDITETTWTFGDGSSVTIPGPPAVAVTHEYSPTADYTARVTITDDDLYSLVLNGTLLLKAPTIGLSELPNHAVIRSGVPIQFIIGQGSTPLVSVNYSVNSGQAQNFVEMYKINTTDWDDGSYSLVVKAKDTAGNVAVKSDVLIVIDDVAPVIFALPVEDSVYGGDKLNISVEVDDPNLDPQDVILYVKFPGDDQYSSFGMSLSEDGTFYRLIEVPERDGRLDYYVNVTDLAGNHEVTEVSSVQVDLHFMDYAWPYLLALAVIAAIGTAAYFTREAKIAVDETFVIYGDGRLISHSTRRLKPGMDDQVLGGMFVAIQDFVKDSFKDVTSFTLRKIEFGEKSVLIEKGSYLYLAVILHGKASRKVALKMQRIVDEIEEAYSAILVAWDGDLDALRGVGDIAKKLYSKAPLLPGASKKTDR